MQQHSCIVFTEVTPAASDNESLDVPISRCEHVQSNDEDKTQPKEDTNALSDVEVHFTTFNTLTSHSLLGGRKRNDAPVDL